MFHSGNLAEKMQQLAVGNTLEVRTPLKEAFKNTFLNFFFLEQHTQDTLMFIKTLALEGFDSLFNHDRLPACLYF